MPFALVCLALFTELCYLRLTIIFCYPTPSAQSCWKIFIRQKLRVYAFISHVHFFSTMWCCWHSFPVANASPSCFSPSLSEGDLLMTLFSYIKQRISFSYSLKNEVLPSWPTSATTGMKAPLSHLKSLEALWQARKAASFTWKLCQAHDVLHTIPWTLLHVHIYQFAKGCCKVCAF